MIVNQATLQAIYKAFNVRFQKALDNAQPRYQSIATEAPSSTKTEEYKWLGRVPRLRNWVGDRVIQNLTAYGYTIRNESFESTVAVDREDIEDDTIGIYYNMVDALGQAAALHPDELVFDLLANGFTQRCYDGQYFFDDDHRDADGPIQSNVTDAPLSAESYAAGRAAMMSLMDEQGSPLKVMPDLLVVPPQLEGTGLEILKAERLANGASNVYRNSARLEVVPDLAGAPTKWFLLDTTKVVKPIIFQRRKRPELVALDAPRDENVFMRKEYLYGVDYRGNAGYGLWQLAYGSTGDGE